MSGPDDSHVREVLRSAHQELRALFKQRDEIVKRIDSVKRTIGGLIDIFGDEILDKDLADALCEKQKSSYPGFTKTCRMVLLEAKQPLTAREICVRIQKKVPGGILRNRNLLGSVIAVLSRLVEHGDVQVLVLESGQRAWQWTREPTNRSSPAQPKSRSSQ